MKKTIISLLVLFGFGQMYAQSTLDSLIAIRTLQQENALSNVYPVIILPQDSTNSNANLAQLIALNNSDFSRYYRDQETGKPFRNEIFRVIPVKPGDLGPNYEAQCNGSCYQVEMYNYGLSVSTLALVNVQLQKVIGVNHYKQMQPEIPLHLKDLAINIANNSPEVIAALGHKPNSSEALMAGTKTALNKTFCERSRHLCVAPTYIKDNKALWVIVDLTDLSIAGIKWTDVGTTGPGLMSERRIQNQEIMECFCQKVNTISKNGWDAKYIITSSDGLMVYDIKYQGKMVMRSVKLVDWHVSYSKIEGFGYSDAVGCPMFSQAAVLAVEPPQIESIIEGSDTVGFKIVQEYYSEGWPTPCNYNYRQKFEFYNDGRFRPAVASIGRGCGSDGIYRPVTRIAFAGENNNFNEWNGGEWNKWKVEKWNLFTEITPLTKDGFQYKIETQETDYFLQPCTGQFNDGGRGDNAYVYVTQNHFDKDEGENDLITIGPCCNTDFRQGPEKFIDDIPESIENTGFIVWYVPEIKNDNTPGKEYCWAESVLENGIYVPKVWPCFSGPMIVPKVNKNEDK